MVSGIEELSSLFMPRSVPRMMILRCTGLSGWLVSSPMSLSSPSLRSLSPSIIALSPCSLHCSSDRTPSWISNMVLSKRLQGEQAPEKKGVPLCSWCSSHTLPPHMPHIFLAIFRQYLHLGVGRMSVRQSVINSFRLHGLHILRISDEIRTPHIEQADTLPVLLSLDAACMLPGRISSSLGSIEKKELLAGSWMQTDPQLSLVPELSNTSGRQGIEESTQSVVRWWAPGLGCTTDTLTFGGSCSVK